MTARQNRARGADSRRSRQPAPPPATGWLRSELARLLRVSPPTIAKYIRGGLLPRAQFRGSATRYQRVHVLRLLAVRHLRADGVVELVKIKAVLSRMTAEQLEAWVLSRPNSPEMIRALQVPAAEAVHNVPTEPIASQNRAQATVAERIDPALEVLESGASKSMDQGGASGGTTPTSPGQFAAAAFLAETWQQLELAPGVVLSWRSNAGRAANELVQRLLSAV